MYDAMQKSTSCQSLVAIDFSIALFKLLEIMVLQLKMDPHVIISSMMGTHDGHRIVVSLLPYHQHISAFNI